MALPLIIAAALAGGALTKGVKALLRNEDPLNGYCSWCGKECRHDFHADGLSWWKTGPIAVLTGGIGTAIAGLVSRNIYRCSGCGKQTLPCRMPNCGNMARSGDTYDDEFCGKCFDGNNVNAEGAAKERSEAERNTLAVALRGHEQRVQLLEVELDRLRREQSEDTARIAGLIAVIQKQRESIDQLRHMLGLRREVWV